MTRKTIPVNGKKYVYLVCVENKNKNGCKNNKSISLEKFEKIILRIINLHIEKVFELDQMIKIMEEIPYNSYLAGKLQDTIQEKEVQIDKKRQYIQDVYEDYKEGIVNKEEYLELKEAFRSGINALEKEITALNEEIRKLVMEKEDRVHWVEQFTKCRGFQELSRELLLRLVEEIRVFDKDKIEVVFKFQSEYEKLRTFALSNDITPSEVT